jgi:hypothetical protein
MEIKKNKQRKRKKKKNKRKRVVKRRYLTFKILQGTSS